MDYEKAYTNAVARAKKAIKDCGDNEGRRRMIEGIFPELKESEDEWIRKEIIDYLIEHDVDGYLLHADCEKWVDWLEKQGEQFAKEKKEIDKQWKRLMAKSKSIGVDLLQRKEEQYKKEKQQWIDKAAEWLRMTILNQNRK